MQQGFLSLLPRGDADLAAEEAGFDADVGQGFGEAEGSAPDRAAVARRRGHATAHVIVALFLGAAFMDGPQRKIAREATGGRAGVDPGEFERHQGKNQVFRAFDEAALGGIHEAGRDPRFVECLQQLRLLGRPFVAVPATGCHETGHGASGHRPGGLHQHLQVVPILVTPKDLADVVAGQSLDRVTGLGRNGLFHNWTFLVWGFSSAGKQ